ncbi:MAG: type IX secretion system membrane protein PorP/SprF [Cytophagales bacterium]
MKKYYTIALLMLGFTMIHAQDIQFSQFYGNSLFMNPSFAGGFHQPKANIHYRGQWLNLEARYNTYLTSIDGFSTKHNSGYGLMIMRDVQGPGRLGSTDISAFYSYELKINRKWTARAGGRAAIISQSLDYSALRFPSQYDDNGLTSTTSPSQNIGNGNIIYPDVSFGTLIFNRDFWFGAAGHHLSQPNQSFINDGLNKLPMSLSFITGYKIHIERHDGLHHNNDEKSISPTVHYKVQGKSDQLDFGMYAHYHKLLTGIWYRGIPVKKFQSNIQNNESMSFMLGMRTKHFIIRYSYDAVVSTLTVSNPRGAHEVGITVINPFSDKRRRPQRRIPCPNFI